MGNRAVLTFSRARSAPTVYLHWNGGRASIEGFLTAARALQISGESDIERMDNLAAMIARGLHAVVNLNTVYRAIYSRADIDNGDNGVYLLSRDWRIVGREYMTCTEECNIEKTRAIAAECIAKNTVYFQPQFVARGDHENQSS